jgi:hypothetical protein
MPDAEGVMMIRLCAVTWRIIWACPLHVFSQVALKFAKIDLWGRSEPGNTHLILIERGLRAGILTPPGRVILRQCSSRRGKHSIDLVGWSNFPARVATQSLCDPFTTQVLTCS